MLLYAATSNPGKLAEFAASASTAGVTVLALPGLGSIPEPVEDAATFLGNAEIKARAYSRTLPDAFIFADDSGLEVAALNGAPGVRSARFANDANFQSGLGRRTDDRNNNLLLERLQHSPGFADRSARFVCALALARNGDVLLRAQGACDGEILHAPRGTLGFGYDPLFFLPSLGLAVAELEPATKWQVSHRGNAFRNLLSQLSGLSPA